ncbi:hypothetical protein [Streptomyces sp. NPDC090112]|uniref:hypothetical protein n=1 Tax=Streptomyces sp. NPDC090112 TaxID=3365949 RepID=UPI003830DAA5
MKLTKVHCEKGESGAYVFEVSSGVTGKSESITTAILQQIMAGDGDPDFPGPNSEDEQYPELDVINFDDLSGDDEIWFTFRVGQRPIEQPSTTLPGYREIGMIEERYAVRDSLKEFKSEIVVSNITGVDVKIVLTFEMEVRLSGAAI